uniref:Uncharacterized protein n=1 Tax=Yoonia rhodophyticola TaxID=3137370 RepID=A0AAN0MBF9_9RHOB
MRKLRFCEILWITRTYIDGSVIHLSRPTKIAPGGRCHSLFETIRGQQKPCLPPPYRFAHLCRLRKCATASSRVTQPDTFDSTAAHFCCNRLPSTFGARRYVNQPRYGLEARTALALHHHAQNKKGRV